jgi:anti-sigma B factor antagonist
MLSVHVSRITYHVSLSKEVYMEITTRTIDNITVVDISGELDGRTAPIAQEQILPLCKAGNKLILDMSQVTYMSSAGLRLLLLLYRQMTGANGRMVLVGLSEDLQDTMSATGFLAYFTTFDSIDAGVAGLQ